MEEMTITTRSPEETMRLGEALGAVLEPGDVVLLTGDLGAGKTTFAKGVGRGLGVAEELTSPTFTLIHEHAGRIPLVHADLYRLRETGAGAADGGHLAGCLDDYLEGEAVVVIEWPEQAAGLVADALCLDIRRAPLPRVDEREFRLRATGPRSHSRLEAWVKRWLFS